MLTHPTLEQINALGLAGMATAYRELLEQAHGNDLSFDERLGLMLDREIALRTDRRLTNRLAAAKLRFANASIADIDFGAHRGLDRRNVLSLAQGAWLKANENLILTGQTGTGKTWIACAFARQAARLDHSVLSTLADAILDRIVHNAHRITLEGDSMRKRKTPTPLTSAEINEINHP
jgi:DNA replication protein DnaC